MPLNLITDEGAEHLAKYYEEVLTKENSPLDSYEAHFNLGLIAWRAGNVDQLKVHMKEAAQQVIAIVNQRNAEDTTATRIPHSVALPFLVVMNFGDQKQKQSLAELKRNQFFQPENSRYKPLADLLDILRNYFAGKTLSDSDFDAVLFANENVDSDTFYRSFVGTLSLGLQAISRKNVVLAEKSVNYLLQQHEQLAFEGGWEKLAEGLLSFWALTLYNIAEKEGVKLGIISPYFPQQKV